MLPTLYGRIAALCLALLLQACATRGPASVAADARDGPGANPPPNLLQVPNAVPRIEPIRSGGPNKPYEVLGMRFEPIAEDSPLKESGLASWYGRKYHGRPTANGEIYDMYAMTAAHPRMPLPSYARVRNPANGREIIVRVNDRGPFAKGRVIDLSYTAALKLDLLRGVAPVELERITFDEIRSGRWQREAATPPPAPPASEPPPMAGGTHWLQLGAFRQPGGAEGLQAELAQRFPELASQLSLLRDGGLTRLQLGPLADRGQAQQLARRLREETGLEPVLLQR